MAAIFSLWIPWSPSLPESFRLGVSIFDMRGGHFVIVLLLIFPWKVIDIYIPLPKLLKGDKLNIQ